MLLCSLPSYADLFLYKSSSALVCPFVQIDNNVQRLSRCSDRLSRRDGGREVRTGPERKRLWQEDCFDLYHVIPLASYGNKCCDWVADMAGAVCVVIFKSIWLIVSSRRHL